MVKRFFLDRIDTKARRPSVGGENHLIANTAAHKACTTLPLVKLAIAWTQIALDTAIVDLVPVQGWMLFCSTDYFVQFSIPQLGLFRTIWSPYNTIALHPLPRNHRVTPLCVSVQRGTLRLPQAFPYLRQKCTAILAILEYNSARSGK